MYWLIAIPILILRWNAKGLIANGQFKRRNVKRKKTDLLCIQETWLKPRLDVIINGYVPIRRGGVGGATFVKESIPYRTIDTGIAMEYVAIEVWAERKKFVIINFYNPCRKLELNRITEMQGIDKENIATSSIPKSSGRKGKRIVPWWDSRNKAFN